MCVWLLKRGKKEDLQQLVKTIQQPRLGSGGHNGPLPPLADRKRSDKYISSHHHEPNMDGGLLCPCGFDGSISGLRSAQSHRTTAVFCNHGAQLNKHNPDGQRQHRSVASLTCTSTRTRACEPCSAHTSVRVRTTHLNLKWE